ncbi:MAG: chemotaxis protein CheW [Gemmata sp.]
METDLERYRRTFFAEAVEHLAALESSLLRLESGGHDPATADAAFRAAHSLKGGADAVGFPQLTRFTHAMEEVLDRCRTATVIPTERLDTLLEATDFLTKLVDGTRAGAAEPSNLEEWLMRLERELSPAARAAVSAPAGGPAHAPTVAGTRAPAEFVVLVAPQPNTLKCGLDPLRLLAELAALGTVSQVRLDASRLPALADLDPEACYLSWTMRLTTDRDPVEIDDVFLFAHDAIEVTVSPSDKAQPNPAPVPTPAAAPAPAAGPGSGSRSAIDPPSVERAGLIADFCSEAIDHLEAADRCLLTLDTDPTDVEALNAVYRGFHSIKGVSSMLGMAAVQTLAHEAENLLNLAREGKLLLRGPVMELVFASVDTLKRQVALARTWAVDRVPLYPDPSISDLLASLRRVCEGGTPSAAPPKPVPAEPVPESGPAPVPAPQPAAIPAPAPQAPPEALAPAAHPAAKVAKVVEKETVRVDKERLDKLINAIGELVIAQSMAHEEFHELTRHTGGHSRVLPELSKIARDLQELSLSLRMVPLSGTFQKMTRLVRDLARKLNKPVELALHGEETELDKTVVDQLGDPLMHMVRNAIDHGLESSEGRAAAGKPAEGHVSLKAYHQGGNVYIELTDDGRGLDRDRIFAKAVEKGIVTPDARLSDSEVYALIFAPGFSTAAAVTDVSGRGVGMDVVRRNVEALQGNILIRTQLGKGTTFTIRLPLTLAIMDGLMVGLGDDVYVLPLLSVVESFRPRPSEVRTVGGRGEVVNVRGEVIPLLRLHQLFGRKARETDPCRGLVVLVEDGGKTHALLVDELLGQMQAVVKSLDANFRRVEGLAGATILGDGRVAMILDIHGLIQLHTQFGGARPAAVGPDLSLTLGDL